MKCSHADIQLHSKIKLVIIRCAMGQMLCQRRYSKKRRICPDLDCGTIWHEFKNAKPAVTAVSFPSATESLHIEHHLVYIRSESILIHAPSDIILIDILLGLLVNSVSMMST